MTNAPRQCPKCGSTLAPDAPEGLCPACLMAGALPTDATIKLTPSQMRTPSHGPVAPAPGELAPLFPQLEIIELLGRGGMGAVYKARQPKLNRFVALKIIAGDAAADPHFAERFQREAQALAKLNHPNIVSVFDFGETGGLFYFLMEFVDGANLRAMMQSGEMRPEAALALIPAFCDALQYAHDEGVVHRDIKPENVLVDKKGRVKIADFGLAKLTGSDAHDHTLTRTGMYLGTPRYMAPEQVEKPETVDHRADIYSLGVVFYEMLTGELPMGRFDPPSKKVDVDVKLDDIVLRSLEKEPSRRYQHASEIKTAVQGVASAAAIHTPPAAAAPTPTVAKLAADAAVQPRLSRMALIGAIWGLFGLIAVIPSFLLTKTVDLAEGRPSSLVYEQPPVAFTVFMGVLLVIGAGAPIGTTILGAISMSNIKKSGGKLYGLPLAFADTIFFPMLLLHGAMAVMLGLLILTIMKLAGVNAGLGALEMGLLAMLPLIVDFFIVRALWRKVIGQITTPAVTPGSGTQSSDDGNAAAKGTSAQAPTRHLLSAFLMLLFFFGFIFGLSFEAKTGKTAGEWTKIITVGALDPLYTRESGPSGFQFELNFFSWSFFAVVVGGIAFGALWRIGREDQGKVPRDPAWWRDWWKQVGIWGGLLLIACVVRTVNDPQAVLKYTNAQTPEQPLKAAPKTENNVTYLDGHTSALKAVAVSADGRTLVSGGRDGRLIVRELPSGKTVNTIAPPIDKSRPEQTTIMSVAIAADNETVYASGNFRLLQARLRKDQAMTQIATSNGAITGIFPCEGGRKLAYIAGGGSEISFLELATQSVVKSAPIFPGKFFGNVRTTAAAPDGSFIAVTSSDMKSDPGGGATSAEPCKLTVFDTQGIERLSWQFADYADFSFAMVVSTDPRTLAVCLPSGKMQRWMLDDAGQWQPAAESLRISPGRYTAAAASRDGKIIWLAEGNQITGIDSTTGKGVAFTEFKIGEKKGDYSGFPIEQIAVTNEPLTITAALWDGRVALAKCWPLEDAAKTSSAAASLLRQVSEKYGALSTLGVTGKTITQVPVVGGGEATRLESTFSINLARPEFYRIEWKQPIHGTVANQGAVWSSGNGHRVLIGQKVSEWLDREQALGTATGVSGGAANTLPGLFFKDEGSGLHEFIQNAAFLPDETVGGEACQVITGDGPGGTCTLWISRKDSFLKQFQTVTSGGAAQDAGRVSSETMTKIAKTLGTDASPEAVSKMTREIEAQQKRVAAMSITTVEVFERTVADELMVKADFEVAVPTGMPVSK